MAMSATMTAATTTDMPRTSWMENPSRAAAPRCESRRHAPASRDRRTSVRHDEGPLGSDALSYQNAAKVAAEMALSVLAYNLTRVMKIVGMLQRSRPETPSLRRPD